MIPGIDVSHYQGTIDWPKVKAAGIQFAYIKATQGASFVDPKLAENVEGAAAVEIPIGLYHLFVANSGEEQEQNWLKATRQYPAQLPAWLDVEPGAVTQETAQQVLELLNGGFFVRRDCVYCDPSTASVYLQDTSFSAYPLALAYYSDAISPDIVPKPWAELLFWQHSCVGLVDGISTSVDLDLFNGDAEAFQAILRTT
jgi:lysozyme